MTAKTKKLNLPKGCYQRSERTFRFRVYNGSDSAGKPIYKYMRYTVTSTGKRNVEKELFDAYREFEKKVKSGGFTDEKITLQEFYYQKWLPSRGADLTPYERENNESIMKREYFPPLGNVPIVQIRRSMVQDVTDALTSRGLSAKTIRKYHSCLSTVFSEAVNREMIEVNPCVNIRFPRSSKKNEIRVFTAEQAMRFIDLVKNGFEIHYPESVRKNGRKLPAHIEQIGGNLMMYCLFNLCLNSGMRRGELLGLTWNHVDFSRNQIAIVQAESKAKSENGYFLKEPKTECSNRVISIPKTVMDDLLQWKMTQQEIRNNLGNLWEGSQSENGQLVFTSQYGSFLDMNYPSRFMSRLIRAYNKTVPESMALPLLSLHECRHSHCTLLLQAGVPVSEIARRLGHSDVSVTLSVYSHWLPENDIVASDAIAGVFAKEKEKQDSEKWNEFGTNWNEKTDNVIQRS